MFRAGQDGLSADQTSLNWIQNGSIFTTVKGIRKLQREGRSRQETAKTTLDNAGKPNRFY